MGSHIFVGCLIVVCCAGCIVTGEANDRMTKKTPLLNKISQHLPEASPLKRYLEAVPSYHQLDNTPESGCQETGGQPSEKEIESNEESADEDEGSGTTPDDSEDEQDDEDPEVEQIMEQLRTITAIYEYSVSQCVAAYLEELESRDEFRHCYRIALGFFKWDNEKLFSAV